MNIANQLNTELLKQPFPDDSNEARIIDECKTIAATYAHTENAIAVLSDLKYNRSYIYYGACANELGIHAEHLYKEIDSIWEEEILEKIHPNDLAKKYVLEFRFFQLLKEKNIVERRNYYSSITLQMKNKNQKYVSVKHRIFYIAGTSNGSLRLTLCLYNFSYENELPSKALNGLIINTATGEALVPDNDVNNILSERETEILRFIHRGKIIKEIAAQLSISINTVNRHRQNILEKLNVDNSIEACRVAELMKLI